MKREKKLPTKRISRKISSSNNSSVSESSNDSKVRAKQHQHQHHQEEANANERQANVTVRLENADSLTKYQQKNPHIKIQNPEITSNFTADELSDDDEIWICEIPASIDVNKLVGESIKLGSKKSTIKTDDGKFECTSSKFENSNGVYQNTLSVVFQNRDGQYSMKNIKPVGRMMLHQKIDDSEVPIELTPSSRHSCTVFPDNLVVRHPLLGRNFEDIVTLSKEIKDKLAESQTKSEQTQSVVRVKQEKEENLTNLQTSPKKSRKRKNESNECLAALKKPKEGIEIENIHDDDLARIKEIFGKSN